MKKTRGESTAELTTLAFAWLWARRGCRALADEVGMGGLCDYLVPQYGGSIYRADVVGVKVSGFQSYIFDVVEVKGSRADARREDMSEGKWHRLAKHSTILNGWLLVAEDVRPEDYAGLPPEWGVLQAAEENTVVKMVRRPKGGTRIAAGSDPKVARSLHTLAFRSLVSRLPFLSRGTSEIVQKLTGVDPLDAELTPDPLPKVDPLPTKVLQVDDGRTYPINGLLEVDPAAVVNPDGDVVPIRGFDGKVIGAAFLKKVAGGIQIQGSIDYASEERLLIETGAPCKVTLGPAGLAIGLES